MKTVVIVCGYSSSGKSTLLRFGQQSRQIVGYHIATPFKAMMYALWKVDVDDRDVRKNYRPNGRETVQELMASAFVKFREWDPNILMPGLHREIEEFSRGTVSTKILAIDGVRTVAEVDSILNACDMYGLRAEGVKVVRARWKREKWEGVMTSHIDEAFNHLNQRIGPVPVLRNSSTLVDWEFKCLAYWESLLDSLDGGGL
jgi:hypothetical protein